MLKGSHPGKLRPFHCWVGSGEQTSGSLQFLQVSCLLPHRWLAYFDTLRQFPVRISQELSDTPLIHASLLHQGMTHASDSRTLCGIPRTTLPQCQKRSKGQNNCRQRVVRYTCLHPRVPEVNRISIGEVYQVTVHELLHLLGLDHCIYFACLMNGSGSLDEDHR